ncbi:MAG: PQQ-dependent sugar dehydrogenase [Halobacteriales archaeon]
MPPHLGRRAFLAVVGTSTVSGCLLDDDGDDDYGWTPFGDLEREVPALGATDEAPTDDVDVETVLEDLSIPWDLSFAPDGSLYLTERTGRVRRHVDGELETVVEPDDLVPTGVAKEGWWVEGAEGGLLGVAVSPATDHLFVYYTAEVDGDVRNQVVRYDRRATDVASTATAIVDDIPTADEVGDPLVHNGGRLAFDAEGYLWITTGDAQRPETARDPSALNGKLLRVDEDGEPAPDAPDHDGDDRVVTGGHRNPQGLVWLDDETAFYTEHGPTMRDEMALVYPGGDYGWDEVRGRPGDEEYAAYADHPDVVPPLVHNHGSTWAPSGATLYTGDALPSWRNRVVVGSLVGQRVLVVTLSRPDEAVPAGGETFDADWLDDAYTATVHSRLVDELGRVRHLEQGPDGALYAITSNWDGRAADPFPLDADDRLVRLQSDQ